MKTGIVTALDGKTIRDDPTSYDSTIRHLLVDATKIPKHLNIIELRGGTALAINNDPGGTLEETIFSIPHGLDFIPKVTCLFYVRDIDASLNTALGQYTSLIQLSTAFAFQDMVFYGVDATNFYIKHRAFAYPTPGFNNLNTSKAPSLLLRVKYIIFNNEAVQEPYEQTYYYQ